MNSDNYGIITITDEAKKIDAKGVQKHVETLASASSPEGLTCTIFHSVYSIPFRIPPFTVSHLTVTQQYGRCMQ